MSWSTPQWGTIRRALIDKGLIEAPGYGVLQFTMPTFAQFVLDVTGIEHHGPGRGSALPNVLPGLPAA